MQRWRSKIQALEQLARLLDVRPKHSRKLHFPIAKLSDVRQSPFEIRLQKRAHRVELEPDFPQRAGMGGVGLERRAGRHRRQEVAPACDHPNLFPHQRAITSVQLAAAIVSKICRAWAQLPRPTSEFCRILAEPSLRADP